MWADFFKYIFISLLNENRVIEFRGKFCKLLFSVEVSQADLYLALLPWSFSGWILFTLADVEMMFSFPWEGTATRGGCKHFLRLSTKAFKEFCKLSKIQVSELLTAKIKSRIPNQYDLVGFLLFASKLILWLTRQYIKGVLSNIVRNWVGKTRHIKAMPNLLTPTLLNLLPPLKEDGKQIAISLFPLFSLTRKFKGRVIAVT